MVTRRGYPSLCCSPRCPAAPKWQSFLHPILKYAGPLHRSDTALTPKMEPLAHSNSSYPASAHTHTPALLLATSAQTAVDEGCVQQLVGLVECLRFADFFLLKARVAATTAESRSFDSFQTALSRLPAKDFSAPGSQVPEAVLRLCSGSGECAASVRASV